MATSVAASGAAARAAPRAPVPVDADLRHACGVIEAVVRDRLTSILAVGSVGRRACENGRAARATIEDYDLVVIVDGPVGLGRPFYRRLLSVRALGLPPLSRPVSIGVLDRRDLPDLPFTLFNYEMRYAHRRLYGADPTPEMPDYDPARMPLIEATRLLLNRGVHLWGDSLRADRGRLRGEHVEPTARRVRKAWLALGDAILIAAGLFHWSYTGRIAASRRCGLFDRFADAELRARYVRAIRFKLSGSPEVVDLGALRQELRACLRVHERTFRFIEQLRLGRGIRDWRLYADGDLRYPDHLVPATVRRLARLVRGFGPPGVRFYLEQRGREAEEVLIRAFPALAYARVRDPRFLDRFLNWPAPGGTDALAIWRRYYRVWSRGS